MVVYYDILACYTHQIMPTSLYIHIPFCIHRCGYCDFNTFAGIQHMIPAYTQAVCEEIKYIVRGSPEGLTVHTIYFGGGTPSLLTESNLEDIFSTIHEAFETSQLDEVSMEANPGTVSRDSLKSYARLGVNRISLGMQSALQAELDLLERQHTFEDVRQAVEWTRNAGIDNLNLDLIYGLPNQKMDAWLESLQAAISLSPEHLSFYALTLEPGVPMYREVKKGLLPEPDADQAADMYEVAGEMLADAGFTQYEISNWARADKGGKLRSCDHNLQYWRNLTYLGVGAGAHGYLQSFRTEDVASPKEYIKRMGEWEETQHEKLRFPQTPATQNLTWIDGDSEIGETMMVGLRLVKEGVSEAEFRRRFGISLTEHFSAQIERLVSIGLLEWTAPPDIRLRLTSRGYLLGNQVFKEFI